MALSSISTQRISQPFACAVAMGNGLEEIEKGTGRLQRAGGGLQNHFADDEQRPEGYSPSGLRSKPTRACIPECRNPSAAGRLRRGWGVGSFSYLPYLFAAS